MCLCACVCESEAFSRLLPRVDIESMSTIFKRVVLLELPRIMGTAWRLQRPQFIKLHWVDDFYWMRAQCRSRRTCFWSANAENRRKEMKSNMFRLKRKGVDKFIDFDKNALSIESRYFLSFYYWNLHNVDDACVWISELFIQFESFVQNRFSN